MLVSIAKFLAGATITAQRLQSVSGVFDSTTSLDELNIANFLDTKLLQQNPDQGLILDYAF